MYRKEKLLQGFCKLIISRVILHRYLKEVTVACNHLRHNGSVYHCSCCFYNKQEA